MRPILASFQSPVHAILRMVTGFLFACHGSQKLFGFPPAAEARPLTPLTMTAGVIELVGGLLVMVGLQTGLMAFLFSGQMAVAYFMAHARDGFFPIVNRGELAVLYCFVFLYFAATGSGMWSIDRLFLRDTAKATPAQPTQRTLDRWEDEGGATAARTPASTSRR